MDLVLSSLLDEMSRQRKARPKEPVEHIDEAGRLDILKRMDESTPPITQADLSRACNVTPAAISLLLSKPIPRGKSRGCKFWPALAKALRITNTGFATVVVTKKDESMRRIQRVLHELSDAELENWLKNGELLAAKR